MPYFTLQLTTSGPIVDAFIGISDARATALKANSITVPTHVKIRALIDTGASCTCIDPSVLSSLNLSATGSTLVNTPTTGNAPSTAFQYDVSLAIPCDQNTSFYLGNVPIIESALLAMQGFHALIGRDILQHCLFKYDGKFGLFSPRLRVSSFNSQTT